MVSVTNPLMDSEIWGANLAGKCVACRSNKAFTPHPTISAVPLPDATLDASYQAYVESNLPAPGGSHPHELQMQKSLLVEQAFRIWSVIEDSNLDPFVPNEVRYQAAPITECGAHLTAQIRPRQSLNSKMPFDRRESQQAA